MTYGFLKEGEKVKYPEIIFGLVLLLFFISRLLFARRRQPIIADPFAAQGGGGARSNNRSSIGSNKSGSAAGGPKKVSRENLEFEADFDWEVPIIAEESLDKLTTMFTIYPS